jgi:hypothetical protein
VRSTTPVVVSLVDRRPTTDGATGRPDLTRPDPDPT